MTRIVKEVVVHCSSFWFSQKIVACFRDHLSPWSCSKYLEMFKSVATRRITTIFAHVQWGILDLFRYVLVLSLLQFVEPGTASLSQSSLSIAVLTSFMWWERWFYFSWNKFKFSRKYIKLFIEYPVLLKLITRCQIALCHCLHALILNSTWDSIVVSASTTPLRSHQICSVKIEKICIYKPKHNYQFYKVNFLEVFWSKYHHNYIIILIL